MKPVSGCLPASALAAISILLIPGQARGQLHWDSNGSAAGFGNTTGTWGTSGFWNTDSGGGAGTFSTATTSSDTVNFGTATLNYDNSAVAIAAGGVTVNSIVYGAGQTRPCVVGTAGNPLNLAGTNPTITVNNTRFHKVILSPIDGSAGLTKAGAGTLVLRGANSYTGGTTVSAGTLSFGTVAAKSTGTHAFNAGTILGLGFDGTANRFTAADIQNAFAGTFTGNLAGVSLDHPSVNIAIDTTHAAQTFSADIGPSARGLVKIANGSNLTLTGANQYSGRTVVSGGSALIVNSLGNIADTSSNIGTNSTIDMLDASRLDISTGSSSDKHFNLLGSAVIFPGNIPSFIHTGNISTETAGLKTVTLATNDTSLTNVKDFQGVISNGSGTVAVIKSNGGNLWLSGNNTYTGATSIGNTGILIIGHANALGGTAAGTTVSNGATLALRNGITTADEALTLTPGTSSTPMLRNFSGNNTWSGTITSNTTTSTNVSRIASDADKLTIAGTVSITGSAHQFVLQGDGTIDITGQVSGAGIITSATAGSGTRKLGGDTNNYAGATRVNGGTLEFTSIANIGATASSLGAPAPADATISLGFDATAATLRYVGTAGGGHTSDRVVNLNGTTGVYTIEASGAGPLVLTSPLTTTVGGTKTLTLSGSNTGSNSISAIPNGDTGTVSVTKSGIGTWILTGTNTYTGATNVNAGALFVNGSTASGSAVIVNTGSLGGTGVIHGSATIGNGTGGTDASLAPGPGISAIATGDLGFASDGILAVELDGTAATSDAANVTGTVTINAASTLNVTITGTLSVGQKFFVVANDGGDAVSGTFSGLPQNAVVVTSGGIDLKISYVGDSAGNTTTGGNDIVLYAEAAAANPYDVWAASKGLTPANKARNLDPDNDGQNNLAEFALNGDPLSASNDGLLACLVQNASLPAGNELTLILAVRNGASFSSSGSPIVQTATADGVTYAIEGTIDLVTIPGSPVSHVGGPSATAPASTGLPDLTGTDWKYHTFKLDASEGLPAKGFLRARFSE